MLERPLCLYSSSRYSDARLLVEVIDFGPKGLDGLQSAIHLIVRVIAESDHLEVSQSTKTRKASRVPSRAPPIATKSLLRAQAGSSGIMELFIATTKIARVTAMGANNTTGKRRKTRAYRTAQLSSLGVGLSADSIRFVKGYARLAGGELLAIRQNMT